MKPSTALGLSAAVWALVGLWDLGLNTPGSATLELGLAVVFLGASLVFGLYEDGRRR